jgi:radical SAM protein with 4Fe4S-binding SPASM domain
MLIQINKLLNFIKDKRKEKKIEISYACTGFLGYDFEGEVREKYFFCQSGINIGSILYNGDIYVCPDVPRIKNLIQGNVKRDRFSDVWNNKFKFFRNKDRTKCEKCFNCEHWEQCNGGALHSWDFEKKEPKACYAEDKIEVL